MDSIFAYLNNDGTIRFRRDSAFYDTKLLEYFEDKNVTYYIRAKSFKALRRILTGDFACDDSAEWGEYYYDCPYYGEPEYETGKCGIKRRIVYKAYWVFEENRQRRLLPEVYAIVTNDSSMSPEEAMDFYENRGASENFNKKLKGDFDAGSFHTRDFLKTNWSFWFAV